MSIREGTRPRPSRAGATLLLAVLGACSSWRVQPVAPAQVLGQSPPSQVRLRLHDGRRVVVRQPVLRSDSVVSASPGDSSALAIAEVDSLEVRKGDAAKTIGLVALIVGTPMILCAATCDFGPDFGSGFGSR